jgi:microcystin-dependent protein
MSLKKFEKSSKLLFPIIIDSMIMNSEKNVTTGNKLVEDEKKIYTFKFKDLNDKQNNSQSLLDILTKRLGELQNNLIDIHTQNTKKIEIIEKTLSEQNNNLKIEKIINDQQNYTNLLNKINTEQENNRNIVKGLTDKFDKFITDQENNRKNIVIEQDSNRNIVKGLIDKFEKNISEQEKKNNQIIEISKNINKMEENISIFTPSILYPGIIVAFNGSIIPSGWNICDGTNNTPDLRGRFILSSGSGIDLTIRNINDTGGAENHSLSIDEIPGHLHSGVTSSSGAHIHTSNANGLNVGLTIKDGNNKGIITDISAIEGENNINSLETLAINSSGLHTHTFTTSLAGGNKQHNNMPPFYVLAYIMRL